MNHRVSTLEDLLILERNLAYSLGAMSDLGAALKTLLETCLTIEGIDCGGIYRMDSTGACDLVLHRHHSPQFIKAVQFYGAESWEAQRVQEGKPIYLQLQSLTLPEMKALWGMEGIRAVAVIPIAHAGHVVACLNVGTKTTDGIPLLIRQCIESIALHSGSVLARLHLEEELRETRENVENLFAAMQDFVLILGRDGTIHHVNGAVLDRLGYTRGEVLGQPIDRFCPETPMPAVHAILSTIAKQDSKIYSFPMRTQTGEMIPLESHFTHGFWGGEEVTIAVARDVSERQKAEHELLRAKSEWEQTFNAVPDMVLFLEPDQTIRRLNQAVLNYLGRGEEEVVGKKCFEVLHGTFCPPDFCPCEKKLAKHKFHRVEIYEQRRKKDFAITLSPLLSEEGELRGWVHIAQDISDRKKRENDRLQLEAKIMQAQKLESLSILAGGIAHDFNNLLMAIMGNTDLALFQVDSNSPLHENLRHIQTASNRAAELCRQMLIYAGRRTFNFEPISLTELVKEMVGVLGVTISKNVTLQYALHEQIPLMEGDVSQVQQIIVNLVTNASESLGNRAGGVTLRTGVEYCDTACLEDSVLGEQYEPGFYVYLEVEDTGCGMDEKTIQKLFDPFFTTKFIGRGLGMAAVMGILQGHRGLIKIASEKDKGTQMRILFPAAESAKKMAKPQWLDSPEWKGEGCILLVDDEESVRSIGAQLLKKLGFSVQTAGDGKEAVAQYKKSPLAFTGVLLDVTMPGMDGFACLQELRKINPQVLVVLSSGYTEKDLAYRFDEAKPDAFIQKPYQIENLRTTFQRILTPPHIE